MVQSTRGSPAFIVVAATDPAGPNDPLTYEFDCDNDGTYESGPQSGSSYNCTFDDGPSAHTVAVRVSDGDGGSDTDSTVVTVENVDPTGTLANDGPVDEGSPVTVSFSGQFDPSSADTTTGFHYAYACDNGDLSGVTYATGSLDDSSTCTFTDEGTFTVKARILDKDGGYSQYMTNVEVTNVAPAVAAGDDAILNEGDTFSQAGSFTDPGADIWTAKVNYGDGSGPQALAVIGKTFQLSHTYTQDGVYTVTVTVNDGTDSGSDTVKVTVNNVAPVVTPPGNQTVDEGAAGNFGLGSFTDPGADGLWHVTVAWGDSSVADEFDLATAGSLGSLGHTYADDGTYTVTITVDDDDTSGTASFTVTVANVAPTLTISGSASVAEGSLYTLNLSASDPGADTISGWSINWDDGPAETIVGNPGSVTHVYDDGPNNFTISATATDEDGTYGAGNTVSVSVINGDPTATLGNNGPVSEGSPVTVNFSGQSDPSSADTTAGFHYAYSCSNGNLSGATYANSTADGASKQCTFADNSSYTVKARILDKDGGYSERSTSVTVTNAKPVVIAPASQSANEGESKVFNLGSFSDAGVNDGPWSVDVDWVMAQRTPHSHLPRRGASAPGATRTSTKGQGASPSPPGSPTRTAGITRQPSWSPVKCRADHVPADVHVRSGHAQGDRRTEFRRCRKAGHTHGDVRLDLRINHHHPCGRLTGARFGWQWHGN